MNDWPDPLLANITLVVSDLDAARAFYCGKLGLPVLGEYPGDYLSLDAGGGVQIGLHPAHAGHDHAVETKGAYLSFLVTDVESLYRKLVADGVSFAGPPAIVRGALEAELQDPDGHLITVRKKA